MKHLRILLILAAGIAASVAFVYSCGGGGGGGGESFIPSIPYTGVNAPAFITSQNAVILAKGAYSGLDYSEQTGGVLLLSTEGQSYKSLRNILAGDRLIPGSLKNASVKYMREELQIDAMPLASVSDSLAGKCDGYADISGTLNPSNGNFDLDVTFFSYSDDCLFYLDGFINMKGSYPDVVINYLTVTYDVLTVTGPDILYTQSGRWSIDNREYPIKESMNMIVRDESNGKTYWMKDYLSYTSNNWSVYGDFTELTVQGIYYDHDHGYVDLISNRPIRIYENHLYPFSGSLELTGSNSSKALHEFVSPVYSCCLCDADGNGTFEYESQPMPWPWSGNFKVYVDDLFPNGYGASVPRSAVGYDGERYFLATSLYYGDHQYSTIGLFVSDLGAVMDTITVSDTGSGFYDMAFDGSNYLLVYSDPGDMGTGVSIVGQLVSTSGEVLGGASGFLIDEGSDVNPAISFDGANYLVVWQNGTAGGDIYGARVSPEGTVLNTFPVYEEDCEDPMWCSWRRYNTSVAFDGENYMVVWGEYRYSSDPLNSYRFMDIYGVRVSPGGTILDADAIPINAASGDQYSPDISFDGSNFMVIWVDSRNSTPSTTKYDIYGSRVTTDGTVLDPEGIEIKTVDNLYFPHSQFNYRPHLNIDFDGTNYLFSWPIGNNPFDEKAGIYADRFTTAGELVNSSVGSLGIPISGQPPRFSCTLYDNPEYFSPALKAGSINSFIVWGYDVSCYFGVEGISDLRGTTLPHANYFSW